MHTSPSKAQAPRRQAGSPVYQVPEITVASNLAVRAALSRAAGPDLRASTTRTSASSFSANNDVQSPRYRPGYSLADLRIGGRNERYEVTLFVKNLTDERANLGDAILIGSEEPGIRGL